VIQSRREYPEEQRDGARGIIREMCTRKRVSEESYSEREIQRHDFRYNNGVSPLPVAGKTGGK
jgi:hypothetical protein